MTTNKTTAIVIGGAHGLGLKAAEALGAAGLNIVVVDEDNNDDRLNEVLAILGEQGIEAIAYDSQDESDSGIEGATLLAIEQFGSADLFVNANNMSSGVQVIA